MCWLSSGEVLVYYYQRFEDDSLFYRKPVKRLQGWINMNMSQSGITNNKECQTILDILKPCDIFR